MSCDCSDRMIFEKSIDSTAELGIVVLFSLSPAIAPNIEKKTRKQTMQNIAKPVSVAKAILMKSFMYFDFNEFDDNYTKVVQFWQIL